MKRRILMVLLTIIMCALFCACGAEERTANAVKEPSLKEKAITRVERDVRSKINDKYDASGGVLCNTASATEVKENRFEVSGKVYIKDKYGNLTSTVYDGTVFFDDDGKISSAVVHVSVPH